MEIDVKLRDSYKSRILAIYTRQVNVSIEKGDTDTTLNLFTKIIELDPNNPSNALIYNNRGTLKANKSNLNGAIDDYTEAIKINSKFVPAYLGRAMVNAQLGHFLDAKKDYEIAKQLDPKVEIPKSIANAISNNAASSGISINPVMSIVVEGLNKAIKGDYNAAIDDYSRAIQQQPNNPTLYLLRGFAKESVEDHYSGLLDYLSAGRIGKPNINSQNEVIKTLTKVIEVEPKNSYAYTYRGFMRFAFFYDHSEAVNDFTKAIEISPKTFTAYMYRGLTSLIISDKGLKVTFDPEKDLIQVRKLARNNSLAILYSLFPFFTEGGDIEDNLIVRNEMEIMMQKDPKFFRLILQISENNNLSDALDYVFGVKSVKKEKKK